MDAVRGKTRMMLAVGLAALASCRAPGGSPADPFATKPTTAGAAAAPGPTAPPGNSISTVNYDAAASGASIADDSATEEQTTVWSKVSKKLSSKSVEQSIKQVTGRGPDEKIAKKLYAEGDVLFHEKRYDEAAKKYAEAADRWPDSLLEEDALYMQGESLFFADRYSKARDVFDKLTKKYENSRHLDRITARQFAVGRYWETEGRNHNLLAPNFFDKTRPWFDTTGNGVKVYENIRMSDPTGPLADDAVMAQATAYFIDGRFDDAAFQYEVLRKDYPQSEHQKQAHLLGLQSYLNAYQGPQYDVAPLEKAETLVDNTIRIYGSQMPDELPRMQQAKEAIRAQRAEREYDLGEYYRRLGYNRAAAAHYANVMKDFPGTKFAEMSEQRTKEIENLPPEPPDYFPWLTRWLGHRTDTR